MTIQNLDGFTTAVPLECGWGLASPLVGEHPEQAAGLLASAWRERKDIDGLILAGLPAREPWLDALVNRFHRQNRIGLGESCVRRIASLTGGFDGFMSRQANVPATEKRHVARRKKMALCLTLAWRMMWTNSSTVFLRLKGSWRSVGRWV